MATTSEKIESITDSALFEILAIRVLREIDDDCRALVHLGMNAMGKTIPGPLDAFVKVPDSAPPKYVMAAFTLTGLASLQRKWLNADLPKQKNTILVKPAKKAKQAGTKASEDTELGDLLKAAAKTDPIRETDPTACFVVYLCTNRRLTHDLMSLVYAKAKELRVEVRFLEQTRMRDFLDGNPYGQWLRFKHLGTAIDQVSKALLKDAAAGNHREYTAASFLISNQLLITTERANQIYSALRDRSVSTHVLLGASGSGKTLIALDIQKRVLASGGLAFWISEEVAARSLSAADALESVLRQYYPSLDPGAGYQAIHAASGLGPLILIVDDINRTSALALVLAKILRWASPSATEGNIPALPPLQVLIPLWPSHWASVSHRSESKAWLQIHTIKSFRRQESVRYLQAVLSSDVLVEGEAQKFAELLRDDPIFLALFADTITRTPKQNKLLIAQNILQSWSAAIIKDLNYKTHVPVSEYLSSLDALARTMIEERALYPTQERLNRWFTANEAILRKLGQLAEEGHICYLQSRDGVVRFQFRHDRLLEFFITQAISHFLSGSQPGPPAIWDPYFTIFLGRAIAAHQLSETVLDEIQSENPVALIAAVAYFDEANKPYQQDILKRAREWLQRGASQERARWHYALSLLQETVSDDVLTLTAELASTPEVPYARFRNGDVEAGIRVLAKDFWPAIRASWLESMIAQALSRHEPAMLRDLEKILNSQIATDELRFGAMNLAGYIGKMISGDSVQRCWRGSLNRKETVQAALWAMFRCNDDTLERTLASILDVVLEIEEDPTGQSYSRRYALLQRLGWSSRHGFTDQAVDSLLRLSEDVKYRSTLISVFAEMRVPVIAKFVARELAANAHNAADAGSFSPFASMWADNWKRWRDEGEDLIDCIAAFYEMWADKEAPLWVREYALKVWNAAATEIGRLREIPREDPLFEKALWYRLLDGDNTIRHDEITLLPKRAFEYIGRVWKDDFMPIVDQAMSEHFAAPPDDVWSNRDYALAHTLRDIPTLAAQSLITKYWKEARLRPLFIQLALYLSTEQSRAFAAEALSESADDPFKHIDWFFGFSTSGLVDRLSTVHLDSLAPYLSRMSDSTLADIVEFCGRHGHLAWAKMHLGPEVASRKPSGENKEAGILERVVSHWMPSKEDLLRKFDWIANNQQHTHFQLDHFFEEFSEEGGSAAEFCHLARSWFEDNRSEIRLSIAGLVIQYWGKRSDLAFLESAYATLPSPAFPSFSEVTFSVMRRSFD